jgi:phage gp29-like protein
MAADVIGTLIEKTGLRIGTSYIYKKFAIPPPEVGEEIAAPAYQPGAATLPMKLDPSVLLALKEAADAPGSQLRVDAIAGAAIRKSAGVFEKMFDPVLQLLDSAESLDDVKSKLEDNEFVEALAMKMDIADIEELLQRAMLYAELEGRSLENA